jgi:hypothetical protein
MRANNTSAKSISFIAAHSDREYKMGMSNKTGDWQCFRYVMARTE